MKKTFIILGFISAIVAAVLSVTHLYHLAITPIIVAFISGLIVLFLSKKQNTKTKTIQYIFLLVIISLALTIYKEALPTAELEKTEQPELEDAEIFDGPKEISEDVKIGKDF